MPLTLPPAQIRSHLGGVATASGFWAKITGQSGAAYAWSEVQQDASGAFSTLTGGRSGTTSTRPGYEVNGSTGVPINAIVWLRPGRGAGRDYRFLYEPILIGKPATDISDGNTGTFVVWQLGAATVQSLTIRNRSGATLAGGVSCLASWVGFELLGWPMGNGAASATMAREVWRGKLDASYSQATGGTVALSVYDRNDIDTGDNISVSPEDHVGYYYSGEWCIAIEDMVIGKITGATNASPIVITSNEHGLSNGNVVVVSGVGGNTAANGTWTVANVATNTFELQGSTGNGSYTSGGKWTLQSGTKVYRPIHPSGNVAHGTVDGSSLIAVGSTATVSVHKWVGGTLTDTGDNVTARNGSGMPIFPTLGVRLQWDRVDKQWLMYPETQRALFCEFGSAVSAGSTGTATFYYFSAGTQTSWSITGTVRCPLAVAANKLCGVDWDQKGQQWIAAQWEC